jgi:hypothetical protein
MGHYKLREFLESTSIKSCDDALFIFHTLLRTNINSDSKYHIFFRGQQNYCWNLTPSLIYNSNNPISELIDLEQSAIESFSQKNEKIRKPISDKEYSREWDLICQAQHAGVKTNLLDVTTEILYALFFATEFSEDVNKNDDNHASIWCFLIPKEKVKKAKDIFTLNPYKLDNNYFVFNPVLTDDIQVRTFEYRMYLQKGGFIALKEDDLYTHIEEIDEFKEFIFKIKVPKKFKKIIRDELAMKSINRESLFEYRK